MKKKCSLFLVLSLVLATVFGSLSGCQSKSSASGQTPITLSEVAHSIFYAPMYAAIENGYFKEEGIDLTLVNSAGADNVMTALISGEADIGFMGSEASIYVYAQGQDDYMVNFAQLTQRAGNFLVAREQDEDFKWEDLKGKSVLGGRAGGMPQMVFEYILKKNGIDPKEVNIDQSIAFGNTAAAFIGSDTFDYTVEFEPFATSLELEGEGYVVASLGEASGYVPYTAYCAQKSYMEANPEIIQSFTNAIQKGLDYVNNHTAEEIADVIQPQFAETDEVSLTAIVERYLAQDTWKGDTIFEESSFDLLQNILEEAGELAERVPYDALVTTEYSQAALK
jgi:NitT/TauT family transport system substrate-binding protein